VISGEALTSAQETPTLPATAIEDWVRACARSVPFRKPAQLLQLQFHCGKPPPAADPSTRIFTALEFSPKGAARSRGLQPVGFSDWQCTW
jgi:hypothetical protein